MDLHREEQEWSDQQDELRASPEALGFRDPADYAPSLQVREQRGCDCFNNCGCKPDEPRAAA
jgi:hypothetical protein